MPHSRAERAQVLHAGTRLPQEGMGGAARGLGGARGRGAAPAHDLAVLVDTAGPTRVTAQRTQVDDGVGRRRGVGGGHRAGPAGQNQEGGNDDREQVERSHGSYLHELVEIRERACYLVAGDSSDVSAWRSRASASRATCASAAFSPTTPSAASGAIADTTDDEGLVS